MDDNTSRCLKAPATNKNEIIIKKDLNILINQYMINDQVRGPARPLKPRQGNTERLGGGPVIQKDLDYRPWRKDNTAYRSSARACSCVKEKSLT